MKTVLQSVLAAAVLGPCFITPAHAGEWYGKLSVGQAETEASGFSLDEGLTYGAALGTSVGPFRVEAGVNKIQADFDAFSLDGDALNYAATAYLDLPVGERASVYAGAGLDYVDASANMFGTEISGDGTGWHWTVGGAYRLSDNIIAEAQLRHVSADVDFGFGDVDLDSQAATLGLRFAL